MTITNDLTKLDPTYRKMAAAGYRPGADTDRFEPVDLETDLEPEIESYAAHFVAEDHSCEYRIGTANFQTLGVMPFVIEASRLLCGAHNEMALEMLRLAVAELQAIVGESDDDGMMPSSMSPGQALDLLIGLHLTEDDLAPENLPGWDDFDLIPGMSIGDGSIRYARGRSGHTELAAAWFPENYGPQVGWLIYVPATGASYTASTMDELAAR